MSRIVRTIALSGAAAAALFASAGTASATTPETATVAVESAVTEAAGTPVTMPSGKTIRITGMDSAGYQANDSHRAAVVTLADSPGDGVGSDLSSSPQPGNGFDPRYNTPNPQYGTNPQQIQTQASGGAISVTVAIGVALLVIVIVMVKKGTVKALQAVACVALGVYLAPTFVGPLVQQLGGSAATSLGNVWAGF
ncbi:hypothetical protein [Streptomyces sp. NBC_01716]|uniref:hypothetical protein n=1 Tax=Streptomyces sp. NBC_01716 TaxID=2975917 RepID=UPI002E355856|nr:hypothetical protein [Streptomyces sp. NBC_01716]